jgi:hypothetical protein
MLEAIASSTGVAPQRRCKPARSKQRPSHVVVARMSRPTLSLVASVCAVALGACGADKITVPPPPIPTPVELDWSAIPGTSGATACQPTISVSMSGPVGSQLTWMGMGFHVEEGSYDQDFDQAFTQRFWAGDGLIAGQSTSSNSAGFGPGMVHITYRFTYTLTTDSPRLHTDSVSTLCQ